MSASRGIAAFIQGGVEGYNMRQRWDDSKRRKKIEDEELEWRREDRTTAAEDRERRRQMEDEDRQWTREERGWTRTERGIAASERSRKKREEDERRAILSDAYNAASEAFEAQGAPLPSAPGGDRPALPGPSSKDAARDLPGYSMLDKAPSAPGAAAAPASAEPQAAAAPRERSLLSALNPVGAANAGEMPRTDAEINEMRRLTREDRAARNARPVPETPAQTPAAAVGEAASALAGKAGELMPDRPEGGERPPRQPVRWDPESLTVTLPDLGDATQNAARDVADVSMAVQERVGRGVRNWNTVGEIRGLLTAVEQAKTAGERNEYLARLQDRLEGLSEEDRNAVLAELPQTRPQDAAQAWPAQGGPVGAQPAPAGEPQRALTPSAAPNPDQPVTTPSIDVAAATAPGPVSEAGPVRGIAKVPKNATPAQRTKSFMQTYIEVAVPEIVRGYLEKGDIETAMQFDTWARSEQTRAGMTSWAKGVHAASIGDETGFVTNMIEAYNADGYFDDGYSIAAEGSGFTRNAEGEIIGARLTFQDQSGQTFTKDFDGEEDLYRMGVNMLAPESVFEQGLAALAAEDERRAAELEHERALELQSVKAGAQAKTPADQVAAARKLLMKNDWQFTERPPEEQTKMILAQIEADQRAAQGIIERPMQRQLPVDPVDW